MASQRFYSDEQQSATVQPVREKAAQATSVAAESSSESQSLKDEHAEWRPGFWAQFPWTGVGALIGVLICSSAAVVVVYESNGRSKSQWKVKAAPNVLINIFNSLATILITMAVGQGIAISWWRKALKGATVEELHNSWSFGSSLMAIVTKFRFFNIMALCALCTKFGLIDSTLFQKALSTHTALGSPRNVTSWVYPTEQFPVTGTLNQFGNGTAAQTYPITFDQVSWLRSAQGVTPDMVSSFQECAGLCNLFYRGIGFASSCSVDTYNTSRSRASIQTGPNDLLNMKFEQHFPTSAKDYSYIAMTWSSWKALALDSNPTCLGTMTNLTCELRPAVIDYPVVVQNSSFSFRKSKEKFSNFFIYLGQLNETAGYYAGYEWMTDLTVDRQLPDFKVVRYLDDIDANPQPSGNTSLGGIALALKYYNSYSTVSFDSIARPNGQNISQAYTDSSGYAPSLTQLRDTNNGCPAGYTDPTDVSNDFSYDSLLYNINLLTLLIWDDLSSRSNYTDPGAQDFSTLYWQNYSLDVAREVVTIELKDEIYYDSTIGYAWAAWATSILAVLLISPAYWRFWHLGRKVSLGPFEIANAFEAPAFSHIPTGNGHAEGVIKAVGKERVQYGQRQHERYGTALGFRGA